MSVQAGGQLVRKELCKKRYLSVLVYSGLNMNRQGVVVEEGQLHASCNCQCSSRHTLEKQGLHPLCVTQPDS